MVWAEHCPFHQCIEYPSPSPSHPQCFHNIRVLLRCSYYSNPFSPLKLLNEAVVPCWISSWIRDHLGVFVPYDRGRNHQSLRSRTLRNCHWVQRSHLSDDSPEPYLWKPIITYSNMIIFHGFHGCMRFPEDMIICHVAGSWRPRRPWGSPVALQPAWPRKGDQGSWDLAMKKWWFSIAMFKVPEASQQNKLIIGIILITSSIGWESQW